MTKGFNIYCNCIRSLRHQIVCTILSNSLDTEGKTMRSRFSRVEEKKGCLAIMSPMKGDDLVLNVSEREVKQC